MQVISRQGVATSLEDLRRCSADGAASIVVLSPTSGGQDPDRVDAEVRAESGNFGCFCLLC